MEDKKFKPESYLYKLTLKTMKKFIIALAALIVISFSPGIFTVYGNEIACATIQKPKASKKAPKPKEPKKPKPPKPPKKQKQPKQTKQSKQPKPPTKHKGPPKPPWIK